MADLFDIQKQIEEDLLELEKVEKDVDKELQQSFRLLREDDKQSHGSASLTGSLEKVATYEPYFEALTQDAKKLKVQIETCSELSDNLSTMIRHLDSRNMKVESAISVCSNFMNFREYKSKIEDAVAENNLPLAVSYLQNLRGVGNLTPGSSFDMGDDFKFVSVLEKEVQVLIDQAFRKAIEDQDMKAVVRYCPLLRAVNLEAEARDLFLEFAKSTIFIAISADAAEDVDATDAATAYAQALTTIFNTTVVIIQQYLPIVIEGMELVHGDIYFLRELHEKCQREAALIMQRYMKFRGVKDMMGPERKIDQHQGQGQGESTESVSDTHAVLDEMSLLIQYCTSYLKYIKVIWQGAESKVRRGDDATGAGAGGVLSIQVFKGPTKFHNMLDSILHKYYMDGETQLLQTNVDRVIGCLSARIAAFQQTPVGDGGAGQELKQHFESSMDECFFLLQKCCQRGISTKNTEVTQLIVRNSIDVIDKQITLVIKEYLKVANIRVHGRVKDNVAKFTGAAMKAEANAASASSALDSFLSNTFASTLNIGNRQSTAGANSGQRSATASRVAKKRGVIAGGGGDDGDADGSHVNDPWGLGEDISCYDIIENVGRYISRLEEELLDMVSDVYDVTQSIGDAPDATRQRSDTGAFAPPDTGMSVEETLLHNCKAEFSKCKATFDKLIPMHMLSLCRSITHGQLVTVIQHCFDIPGCEGAGMIKLHLHEEQFLGQPCIHLFPKIFIVPIAAVTSGCVSNLSGDTSKCIFIEAFVDGMLAELELLFYKVCVKVCCVIWRQYYYFLLVLACVD